MKLATSLSVLTAAVALSSPVLAQSANKNIVVGATLTSVCRFTTSADLALPVTYVAFQSTDATKTGTASIECTRDGAAPTLSFDATSGTVAGLAFSLAQSYAQTSAGSAPDATNTLGLPRTGTVTVTATVPAGQAGSSTASASQTQVLTVTF